MGLVATMIRTRLEGNIKRWPREYPKPCVSDERDHGVFRYSQLTALPKWNPAQIGLDVLRSRQQNSPLSQ